MPHTDQIISEMVSVISRRTHVNALESLIKALSAADENLSLTDSAIGIDANVMLRIAGHERNDLIVDYLAGIHQQPLIIPGQVIQEFWNNQAEVVATVAKPLTQSFASLRANIERIDDNFGSYLEEMKNIMDSFESEHGHIYDAATVLKTSALLDILKEKSLVPFAPRDIFSEASKVRKSTKTPPGFKDSGDGDFYVWIDFLFGLRQSQMNGKSFSRAIFVTNDTKKDWSRAGVPHPLLSAEVKALLNVEFETWTLTKLVKGIDASM